MKPEIRLVRLIEDFRVYSASVSPIFFQKKPDALITLVSNDGESPILFIEFTTAVFTADHELQRYDGVVGALKNRCPYLKIAPLSKVSAYQHGGDVAFDYLFPFALAYKTYGPLVFHLDWPCDSGGKVLVQREYLSCPPLDKGFVAIVEFLLTSLGADGRVIPDALFKTVDEDVRFREWFRTLEGTTLPVANDLDSNRTRWIRHHPIERIDLLELKINRMGHAMDPERGMLAYFKDLVHLRGGEIVAKLRFVPEKSARYTATSGERAIREHLASRGLRTPSDFLFCFCLGSGLGGENEFRRLEERIDTSKSPPELDLSEYVSSRWTGLNKPLRTILTCARALYLEDAASSVRIVLRWRDLPRIVPPSELLITPIKRMDGIGEDEVTYIAIHNVLRPNGFSILAAS